MEHSTQESGAVYRESEKDSESEVRVRIHQLAESIRNGDVKKIMSFYSPRIVAFDMMPPLQFDSKEKYQKESWENCFTKVFEFPVKFAFKDVFVECRGDIAFSHSIIEMAGQFKNDGKRIENWLRNTTCWNKVDGIWMIVHEHNSVPLDEAMKGIMDLKPEGSVH